MARTRSDVAGVSDIYREVYQALDASVAALTCLPSSEAVVRRALSRFQGESSDQWAVDRLGEASIALQALAAAVGRGECAERLAATDRLSRVARSWIERLPMH
ncbi:MAG TPA: hypothetical protein VJ859_09105 [Allosphingosinicella sp.]|nr:hypothetical protein [Allosphingosinicella sp.]